MTVDLVARLYTSRFEILEFHCHVKCFYKLSLVSLRQVCGGVNECRCVEVCVEV